MKTERSEVNGLQPSQGISPSLLKIVDDDVTIHFNKRKRIINLVTHCLYEFYFKKNDLKLEEQYAIVEFHLSSPKQLLLDYCNKCKYIAVMLMCGSWRRALFVRKLVESYVKAFYLDYGFADEDIMEEQMDQISTISSSKTCN